MKIKIKINRCDPTANADCQAYLQAYTVEAAAGMTILEALIEISEKQDPTLSFRRSCRSAICGSCAVTVNGFPKLACNTQLIPEFKKKREMLVEPMRNMPVLKDLIVDQNPFWRKIDKVTPFLIHSEELGGTPMVITTEDEHAIDRVQKCIMCGSCNSACNALEIDKKYIGPAALSKSWRFVGDVREGMKRKRLLKLGDEHGMWDCVRCYHCSEYCPKDVKPLEAIEKLRAEAITEEILDNDGARHVEALVGSVERVGRLDEAAMTFKTLGFLRSLGMIPMGLKMEMHGKMPHPIIFAAIEDLDEVKKIYETVEKKKKARGRW